MPRPAAPASHRVVVDVSPESTASGSEHDADASTVPPKIPLLTTWLLASGLVLLVLGLVFFVMEQTLEVEALTGHADAPGTVPTTVACLAPIVGLTLLTAGVVGISRQIARIHSRR